MWFYAKDGNREGPVSLEDLRGLIRQGSLPLTTVVWSKGMREWRAANEVPEVISAVSEHYVAQPVGGGPVVGGPPPTNGLAIASLVLGLVGLVAVPLLASIAAVVCGHLARSHIREAKGRLGGDGMALTGLITGYVGVIVPLTVLALILAAIFGGLR